MHEVTGGAGQMIAGRYRLVEPVGRGGMGTVWRAEDQTLGGDVAIKIIHPHVAARPFMLERFVREAKAAASLRSRNVVSILDHGVDDGTPFIAMEFLQGESLASRLAREGKLNSPTIAGIMKGVGRALGRAHKNGIIHRDLKPDNIFLAKDDEGETVKVLDFGVAKVIGPMALDSEERRSTETGTMLGTPCYMSPEQARGRKEIDARSDLWSFGVIAFECLTGKRPFDSLALGELMMQICSEPIVIPSTISPVPPGFDAWFAKTVERDPNARFQTVAECANALAMVLGSSEPWVEPSIDSDSGDRTPQVTPTDIALSPTVEAQPSNGSASVTSTGESASISQRPSSTAVLTGESTHVPPRGRRGWIVGGSLFLVATAAFAWVRSNKVPPLPTPVSPPSIQLETANAPQAAALAPAASNGPERRVPLLILPADATVEIDGLPAPAVDGKVVISGSLGSVHKAKITKGTLFMEGQVSITDSGAFPAKLELSEPPTSPSASVSAAASAPSTVVVVRSPGGPSVHRPSPSPGPSSPTPSASGKAQPREDFE
ncbi:MAG: serine/threonine protein kinase [Polyangiaceae bacterium]|nr:serine/threonine protein kinase [Polyangiaceae bacterium]